MKYFISTAMTCLLLLSLHAQNTWLGGDGYWHDASKWSYASVPTANESVVISNGTVKIQAPTMAYANRVHVMSSGTLTINFKARLTVDASGSTMIHGMSIGGHLNVWGQLLVTDVNSGDGISVSGNGDFRVYKYGNVNISNTAASGIWNNASVINMGYIFMEDTGNFGIYNYGSVDNDRGKLVILGDGSGGIICNLGGQLTNSGKISVKGGGLVLQSDASVLNDTGGSINISYPSSYAIKINPNNNTFDNYGQLTAAYAIGLYGLYNEDTFINHKSGSVTIDDAHSCIINLGSGFFSNEGSITLGADVASMNIWNRGTFHNYVCGNIFTEHKVNNYTPGVIDNSGNWYNHSVQNSLNFSTFYNDGLIEDTNGTFPTSIINNEAIAKPLSGLVQEGVPVPNALEVGMITKHTLNGWFTDASLAQSAGTYDMALNEWTPNSNAVGLTEVFVSFTHDTDACDPVISVPVTSGVQPYTDAPEALGGQQGSAELSASRAGIFPNPNRGNFTLKMRERHTGIHRIQMYDVTGKLIWQEDRNLADEAMLNIRIGKPFAAGLYQLLLLKEGSIIQRQPVVLAR